MTVPCTAFDGIVSTRYARVFTEDEEAVVACPACTSRRERTEISARGRTGR